MRRLSSGGPSSPERAIAVKLTRGSQLARVESISPWEVRPRVWGHSYGAGCSAGRV